MLHNLSKILLLVSIFSSAAIAEANGPDYWSVTGVASNDVLWMHTKPDHTSEKVGEIPHNGKCLDNLKCTSDLSFVEFEKLSPAEKKQLSHKSKWCLVRYKDTEGWVSKKFLTEGEVCGNNSHAAVEKSVVRSASPTENKKIFSALKKFDNLLGADSYAARLVRLKDDSPCENPSVFLNGKSGYCGTGGCTFLVLKCTEKGYEVMSNTSVADAPVYLSTHSTNGYRDIKLYARKVGDVVLKYDGKKYPDNASMESKSIKEPSDILIMDAEQAFGKVK